MRDSPLEAAEDMELTPCEIDELETSDVLRSEVFWVIQEKDLPTCFPGQKLEKARVERRKEAIIDFFFESFTQKVEGLSQFRLFGPPQPAEHEEISREEHDTFTEPQEGASEPQRDAACPPLQKQ